MQLNYKCHWHQRVATSATADNISQDKLVRCWFYISRKLLCCACCNRGYLNFFLHQNLLVNKFSPYAVLVPPSLDDPLHVLYCDPGFFLLLVSKIERPEEMIVITIHVSATLCTRAFPVGSPSTKWRSVLRYTWFDIFCEIVSYKKVWYLTSCCKVVIMMKQYDWMAPHISHEELCDIFHLHDFPACYPPPSWTLSKTIHSGESCFYWPKWYLGLLHQCCQHCLVPLFLQVFVFLRT